MRQTLGVRAAIGLWVVWLGVALVEPAGLHACSMHAQGAAAAGSERPAPPPAHGDHSAHHGAGGDESREQSGAACLCLGDCGCATVIALTVGATPWVTRVVVARPVVAAREVWFPAAEHTRPFGTGPPGTA